MPPYPIKESFNWMTPEFKVADRAGKNTIRIKGVAMKSDSVSKNNRKYVDEELIKAARTFYEKPVTINHDPTKKVGTIKWMEYENGCLEYLADINKQPYVDMLRDGSADIKGVSIEALYLHNRCPKCNEKFYSEEEFRDHMRDVHFIHNFETTEPHGIVGQALSLVLSPEEPGYTGTTIELMEKYQKPVSQLLETVITTEKEKIEMTKKKETKVPYKHRDTIREQEEPEKDEHGCVIGKEKWDGEKCVPIPTSTEQDEHQCGENEHWDEEAQKCVPDEPTATEQLTCPEGFHKVTDEDGTERCVADEEPKATETEEEPIPIPSTGTGETPVPAGAPEQFPEEPSKAPCPEGQVRDPETGLCIVPVTSVEPTPTVPITVSIESVKLPTLLKLGEPFAGYSSMDDCIAKNPDKEDPASYCATIMRKVEGEQTSEIKESHNIYETQQAIMKSLQEIRNAAIVRDAKIAAKVNSLTRTVASILTGTNKLVESINKTLKKNEADAIKLVKLVESASQFNLLTETKNRTAIDKKLHEQMLTETKKNATAQAATQKQLQETHTKLAATQKQLQEYATKHLGVLATSIAETKQKLATVNPQITKELATLNKRIDETATLATEQKKDFETILSAADKNVEGLKETVKTLEEWKATKEKELKETADKQKDKEATTKALKEALSPLQTEIENLKASLKGATKQKHPNATPPPEQLETDKLPYESEND